MVQLALRFFGGATIETRCRVANTPLLCGEEDPAALLAHDVDETARLRLHEKAPHPVGVFLQDRRGQRAVRREQSELSVIDQRRDQRSVEQATRDRALVDFLCREGTGSV